MARGQASFSYEVHYNRNRNIYHYEVDLVNLQQHNLDTGTIRAIRRLEVALSLPPF